MNMYLGQGLNFFFFGKDIFINDAGYVLKERLLLNWEVGDSNHGFYKSCT